MITPKDERFARAVRATSAGAAERRVIDTQTNRSLGAYVRTEFEHSENLDILTHYTYQDRKGRFGLARVDRSHIRNA